MVSTAAAIGPGLGGYVRDHTGNFIGVFAALAAIGLVLVIAVIVMRRPARASDDSESKLAPEFV
jgi:cyanate permease